MSVPGLSQNRKEHWYRTHDPREAMVGGLARSGRVIFATGAVMVAESFHVRPVRPLPLKEMGIIVGIAVLLDAARAADARADPAAPHGLGRLVAAEVARPALPDVRFGH